MSSSRLDQHWNTLFASKSDPELGWYESNPVQTLTFVDKAELDNHARIMIPGAGTSNVVDELLVRGHALTLNDISDQALAKLSERVGEPEGVTWLHCDMAQPLPAGLDPVSMWIDRAVLHFITAEAGIQCYFNNLRSLVRPGGYVLLAEFATTGATECAGLEVHRYSLDEMQYRMGPGFTLQAHEAYTHTTPNNEPRPYLYALFRKSSDGWDNGE